MDPVGWMAPAQEITQADADRGIHAMEVGSSISPGLIGSHHYSFGVNFGFRNGVVLGLSADDSSGNAVLNRFQKLLRGTNTEKDYP